MPPWRLSRLLLLHKATLTGSPLGHCRSQWPRGQQLSEGNRKPLEAGLWSILQPDTTARSQISLRIAAAPRKCQASQIKVSILEALKCIKDLSLYVLVVYNYSLSNPVFNQWVLIYKCFNNMTCRIWNSIMKMLSIYRYRRNICADARWIEIFKCIAPSSVHDL